MLTWSSWRSAAAALRIAISPPAMLVDPATAVRRHLEGRRHVQQRVSALPLDEDALAGRAEEAEVAPGRRQEAVDADVPLRQHRVEHPAHPHGGGQRGLVGRQRVAGADDVAVRPEDAQLLGLEHHVPALSGEERQQAAVLALGQAARRPRIAPAISGSVRSSALHQRARGEQRRRRRRVERGGCSRVAVGRRFRQRHRPVHEHQVGRPTSPRGDRPRPSRRIRGAPGPPARSSPARPGRPPSNAHAAGACRPAGATSLPTGAWPARVASPWN